ncbi:MAG: hypothetical protein R3E48_00945 [Burkholderiaceae bacterium]
MGILGWIVLILIIVSVLSALANAQEESDKAKIESEGPFKLSGVLREEFSDHVDQITVIRCGLIVDRIKQERSTLRRHYHASGRPKNERSRQFLRDFAIRELAPLISEDFRSMAASRPDEFFEKFEKALALSH